MAEKGASRSVRALGELSSCPQEVEVWVVAAGVVAEYALRHDGVRWTSDAVEHMTRQRHPIKGVRDSQATVDVVEWCQMHVWREELDG